MPSKKEFRVRNLRTGEETVQKYDEIPYNPFLVRLPVGDSITVIGEMKHITRIK